MNISAKDYDFIWHPYTHQLHRQEAKAITHGKGALLFDEEGNEYIDGISSWWVNVHGHGNKFIAKKIYAQAKKLQQVIFTSFTHKPAVALAEKLLSILPGNPGKIFYSDNGSTATEVAVKMCLQYWVNKGEPARKKIIAFENAYHGDTFGAMSISQRGTYTDAYRDKLFEVLFIPLPNGQNLEQIAQLIDQRTDLAGFIYEPLLLGAGGMKMYEPKHFDNLLRIVRGKKLLLIADEVLTGFYRTGKMFASERMHTKPDIICLSKGLTGGTMALGVTSCTAEVHEAFLSADKTKTLFHGHSFTANPLACSAANASLELFAGEKYPGRIEKLVKHNMEFATRLITFSEQGIIKDVRQCGTVLAFEVQTKENDGYLNDITERFSSFCISRGVFLRSLGNTIYVMPPYCITKKQFIRIEDTVCDFLDDQLSGSTV